MNIKEMIAAVKLITGSDVTKEATAQELSEQANKFMEENLDRPACGYAGLNQNAKAYLVQLGYQLNDEEEEIEYIGEVYEDEPPIVNKIVKAKTDTDGKVKSLKSITGKTVVGEIKPAKIEKVKAQKEPKQPKEKVQKELVQKGTGWIPTDADLSYICENSFVNERQIGASRVSFWLNGKRMAKLQGGRLYFQYADIASVPVSSAKEVVGYLNANPPSETPKPKAEKAPKPKAEKAPVPKKKKIDTTPVEEVVSDVEEDLSEVVTVDGEEEFDFES